LFRLAWSRLSYSYEQLFDPSNDNQRLRQIEATWIIEEIVKAPITGIGLGGTYYAPGNGLSWSEKHWVHNTYLQVPLRMGIPGLLVLLWMILSFITTSRRVYLSVTDPTSKALIIGIWGSLVCLAIQSVTAAIWFMHPVSLFAGMAWALVVVLKPR
jgi:O-antigen ligase